MKVDPSMEEWRQKVDLLIISHIALSYSIVLNIMIIEWAAFLRPLPKIDTNPRLPFKAKAINKLP